jgi:hypothetical protein
VPVEIDLDVVEEAGVPKLPDVLGQGFGLEGLPDALADLGEDIRGRDPAIPHDLNLLQRQAPCELGFTAW